MTKTSKKRPSANTVTKSFLKNLAASITQEGDEDEDEEGGEGGGATFNINLGSSAQSSQDDSDFINNRTEELKTYDVTKLRQHTANLEADLRKERQLIRAFKKAVPDGAVVLTGDLAEIVSGILKTHGGEDGLDAKALKTWLDGYDVLKKESVEVAADKTFADVARVGKVNKDVLKTITPQGVEYEVVKTPNPNNANEQIEQVIVKKADGTKIPFSTFLEEPTIKLFEGSLKVTNSNSNNTQQNNNTQQQQQVGVFGTGTLPSNTTSGGDSSSNTPVSSLQNILNSRTGTSVSSTPANTQNAQNNSQSNQQAPRANDTFALYGSRT